jgi:hypothetical protein
VFKISSKSSVTELQSQGYSCINSFHLFIFVFIVCKLNIHSPHTSVSLSPYVEVWYMPIVIWIFFSIYEIVSLLKLKNCESIMVIGFKNHEVHERVFRGLALVLGLWLFYLGLCIPASIFLS